MKVEVKEENQYGDHDVLSARHRLTGALQDLVQQDGDESGSSDDDSRTKIKMQKKHSMESPLRITKTKRRRLETATGHAFHHTYVMKLFDRSVDLAQFEEDTPLYPICRAWMANQPRNPNVIIKRRHSSPEPENKPSLNGDDDNSLADIYTLPPPETQLVNRVPSPTPEQMDKDMDTGFLNNMLPPSREELMHQHSTRWCAVRQKWQDQAHKYEERYHASSSILTAIYNKAQENMA